MNGCKISSTKQLHLGLGQSEISSYGPKNTALFSMEQMELQLAPHPQEILTTLQNCFS